MDRETLIKIIEECIYVEREDIDGVKINVICGIEDAVDEILKELECS